ncbi:RE2, partial [Symbiodinium sp. KB8]
MLSISGKAEWLDMLERGDESARAGLFSGVARDLQELCDFNRLSRFRHVLQEHMMNDAHRYAFHRLRVHLLHERCPFTHPGVWRSEVCQWLQEDETFLLMALEINNPAAEVHTPILLYGAREQIQAKLDLAKMLAGNPRVDPLVLADVAPRVLHDREFLLIAAKRSGAILQMAAPELQQDLELVKACVMQSGSALRFVAPELKANKDIVLRAVGNSGLALEHAAWELKDDEEVVQLAVRCTGLALEFASTRFAAEALKDDMDVVSRAVQVSGQALKHVSARLRNSREVVVLAARQHAQSLQHASSELRSDLDTVIDAVSASFKAFEFASPELRAEPKVIRCAAKQLLSMHGIIVRTDAELPEAIETNVLLVSKESGQHLLAALQTGLLTTRTFGLAVVRHDPQLYRRLEEHVKADKEVSLEAVKRLPDLFPDMPFQTRNQLDVQVAAVKQKPEMISFVLPTDVTRVQRAVAAVAQVDILNHRFVGKRHSSNRGKIGSESLGMRCCLLWLALLPGLGAAAVEGDPWFSADYEYNYIESLVLIAVVFLELVFEVSWHLLSAPARKSFYYGQLHEAAYEPEHRSDDESGRISHVRLYQEFANRMSSEFMSLGFLAFMIFCSNQLGGFDFMASTLHSCSYHEYSDVFGHGHDHSDNSSGSTLRRLAGDDCTPLPPTPQEWVHLVELVHVQLFCGMMMYYLLVFGIVRGAVQKLKSLERLRLRRISNKAVYRSPSTALQATSRDEELREYLCLREYFIHKVLLWRYSRPRIYANLKAKLGISPDAPEATVEEKELIDKQIKEMMDDCFAFSSYLALNVEKGVKDSIELHAGTWIAIIILFSALATLYRFAQVNILDMMPLFVALALLLLLLMVLLTKWRLRAIQEHSQSWLQDALNFPSESTDGRSGVRTRTVIPRVTTLSASPSNFGTPAEESVIGATLKGRGRFSPEMYINRFLQIFLFVISYTFSRSVVEFNAWTRHFEFTLLLAAGFVILYLLLLYLLPSYVPVFLQLMALPPFLDDDNLKVFLSVLDDDFALRYVVHDEHSSRRRASTSSMQGVSPHVVRRRASSSSSLAGASSSSAAFRLPRAASGHMTARNDTLVVVSELVSILESCDDVRDLRGLREILRRQLPEDVSLPAASPSPPADVDVPITVDPWLSFLKVQRGEGVMAPQVWLLLRCAQDSGLLVGAKFFPTPGTPATLTRCGEETLKVLVMVVQVASLNFCQLWKRLLIARRKKRQSSFSPPRGLSFFSRFDMSSAEHLVVVVRPLVKSRPGITKHSVRHGRHGCHGYGKHAKATEELILSWFPKGVKVVQARDPGTTGNFEITVNGRLVHSKKTQSQGFFEAAPQAFLMLLPLRGACLDILEYQRSWALDRPGRAPFFLKPVFYILLSYGGNAEEQGEKKEGSDPPKGPPGGPSRSPSMAGSSSAGTSEIKSMLRKRMREQTRPKSSIGSVKIEELYGDRRKYRSWKRAIEAQTQLYQLEAAEVTMLVYLSTKGDARDVLDQLALSEYTCAGGDVVLWKLLDESYDETSSEQFERAERELQGYRRLPGQSIASYVAGMKRLKAQYVRVDPETVMSAKAWGQRLLNRASLGRRERLDVYYSAGGYDPVQIEAALRYRCANVHEEERKVPTAPGSRSSVSSGRSSTTASSTPSSPTRRPPPSTRPGHFGFRKKNAVHLAAGDLEDIEEEEDLDMLPGAVLEDEFADQGLLAEDDQNPEHQAFVEEQVAEEEEASQDDTVDGETVREAFAAGWKAKGKQAAQSCGQTGHWRGDPCCPNVLAGKDPPHRPGGQRRDEAVNFVNFTFVAGSPPAAAAKREWQVVGDGDDELYVETSSAGPALEPIPRPMHDVRVSKAALGKTRDREAKVKLSPLEALAAVDSLSKEDKKSLRRWLEQEEQDEGLSSQPSQLPVRPRPAGYEREREKPPSTAPPWPETSTVLHGPVPPQPPVLRLPERKDRNGRDKAKAVLQREMEEFRHELWQRSWNGRRTIPSSASPVASVTQARCVHRFEDLIFSGNQHAHWARCKACDLKHVLYFSERHGVLASSVVVENVAPAPVEALAAFGGSVGQVILDSGCRTAVAGSSWHGVLQELLQSKGITWETVEEDETFQFGAGGPEKSHKAFVYPVGIYGQVDALRMSCVDGGARDCPGLVGPSELARWRVCFDFAGRTLSILGETHDMVLSHTRHPALSIVDFPPGDPWQGHDMKHKAEVLKTSPHSFAFPATAQVLVETQIKPNDIPNDRVPNEFFGDFGAEARRHRNREWLDMLENDLGVKVIQQLPDAEHTGSEDEAEDRHGAETDSVTSHEFGVLPAEDEEDTDFETEDELVPDVGGKPCFFHKAMRKKVREARGAISKELGQRPGPTPAPAPELPRHVRRSGPWHVLEVFSMSMVISLVAVASGWEAGEPLAMPNWDLLNNRRHREDALDYVCRFDPDLLVISWPSSPWLSAGGKEHGDDYETQAAELWKHRRLLAWVQQLVHGHRARGGALLGENPLESSSWAEPLVVDTWAGLTNGKVELCAFGLQRPAGEWGRTEPLFLRMPRRVVGHKAIVERISRLCPGGHRHGPCLGGACVKGLWRDTKDFPGCFPEAFAKEVIQGAQTYLEACGRRRRGETFVVNPTFAEEELMESDQEWLHDGPDTQDQYSPSTPVDMGEVTREILEEEGEMEEELAGSPSKLAKEGKMERIDIVHRRLGHPPNETLVRMLQLGGASEDMIEMARHFDCPVCRLGSQPKRPFAAKADSRAVSFGLAVHLDLKFEHDFKGETFVCLSMVDEATTYHAARLLRNRTPEHVARKFVNGWVGIYGVPQRVTLDQGGEFEEAFVGVLEAHSIHSRVAGSHSPWQNGYAERHGALLGTAWSAIIAEHQSCGRVEMKTSLACALQAKNAVISRSGHSAHLLAFGRQACFPDLLDEDIWSSASLGHALSIDSEVARMAEMRSAAKVALLRGDIREKIKRALRRAPAGERRGFAPGELVFFWSPRIGKGRYRRDIGCWRGPAVVILPESHERYFVSWRGRCLLLSTANLKGAGYDTPAEQDLRRKEVEAELEKGFVDMTDEPAPPEEPEATFAPQLSGLRPRRVPNGAGRRMTEARKMMQGLKSVKKSLGLPFQKKRRRQLLGARALPRRNRPAAAEQSQPDETEPHEQPPPDGVPEGFQMQSSAAEQSLLDEAEPHEPPPPDGVPSDSALPQSLQDLWDQAPVAHDAVRDEGYDYLDDVPYSVKRKLAAAQPESAQEVSTKRLRTGDVANFIMVALAEPELNVNPEAPANEWLPRGQVRKLADLLDMPLTAARFHRAPRKRLQNPGPRWRRHRVTVMLGQDPRQVMIAEETPDDVAKRPRHKCPHLWRGATFFYDKHRAHLRRGELKERQRQLRGARSGEKVFVASDQGVFQVTVPSQEVMQAAFADVAESVLRTQAFILKMKANGKELDPKFFNETEKAAFDKSDRKEWQAWLDNHVIEQLSPAEAAKVPRERIFRVPARVVRTNKATAGSTDLVAKSRIVLPGHLDPDILGGQLRTDSPTTTMTAVRMCMAIALKRRWKSWLFDVSTAFLSGKNVDRHLFCRPPGDLSCVDAHGLWKVLKSAYGLAEAPRLWYLQARELLVSCGFVEVPFAPATFVKLRKQGGRTTTVAVLCLHVDDGFLAVENGREAAATKQAIDERFSIKEWIEVGSKPAAYLGMKVFLEDGAMVNDMTEYVLDLKEAVLRKRGAQVLDAAGLKEFRRLIAQLRWPIHLVVPEMLCRVSLLAQRVSQATWTDLSEANKLLEDLKQLASEGKAKLHVRPLNGTPELVTYFDAALGSGGNLAAQRGEAHFLVEPDTLSTSGTANLLEFHSNKISRVVRSSMAAECCAMSSSSDRLVYNMKLWDALYLGKIETSPTWRQEMVTRGHLVTDARSLFDHVHGSNQLAAERQTSLDILGIRQMVQEKLASLHWVPTWRQYGDCLTKPMEDILYCRFKKDGLLNVKQSAADAVEEERRALLRKAQRERRKIKLKQARQDEVKAEIAKEVEVLGDAAPASTGDFKDGKETSKGGPFYCWLKLPSKSASAKPSYKLLRHLRDGMLRRDRTSAQEHPKPMGSAQEPVEQDHGSQTPKRPGSLRSRSAKTSPGASPAGLFVASDIIARLPERHKLDLQVQMHRQTDESAEMLALSRCLLSDDAQPEPLGMGWSGTTWLSIVRKELVELDDRLSRQLQRIQSQSDRVMEVVLTSLEEKVAQVISNQPMMEWRLAELGASVKGLQEQLETQACRTDATEARLQRWKTTIESDMQNLTVEAPVPVQAEPEPVPRSLDAEACRAAVVAELRGSTGGPKGVQAVQESGSAGLHLEDIAAAATRAFGAETATLKDQIAALQEVQDALRCEVTRLADRPGMQVDASSAPSLSDRVERAEAAASSQQREELEASVAEVTEVSRQAGPAEGASAKEAQNLPGLVLKASASEEALGLEQVQARMEQLEASLEGLSKAIPIMEFQDLQAEVCSSKGRIDSIETAGSSSLARVQELVAAMDGLKNNIEDLRATTANPAVDMVDIRTSMLRLKARVDHFESQLQPAKVRSAIARVDHMEAASAACQAQLQQLSGSLEDTKEGMQGWRTTADETLVGLANELHACRDQVETIEAAHSEAQKQMHLLEAGLNEMKESRQPHLTTEFGEDCRAAFQSIGQHTDELQAIKRQLGSLQSEIEANRLNDINGRVQQVEAASAAGNTQLQELAASIGGIQESVKQLEGVVRPLDAELPAAVEAMRKQIDNVESMEASRLNDISGRVENVASESLAQHAQLQELAASIGGIQESAKQLRSDVDASDTEISATVQAIRKQIDNVESLEASMLNDINGRIEHMVSESAGGRAELQELAASIGGIQESVKQLESVVVPLDATLPAAVEAMREQIVNLQNDIEANSGNDASGRVEHVVSESAACRAQLQELAASIGGIQESVKQLEGVVRPLDAELPAAVEAMRKQIDNVESMEASRLNDISGRVEHVVSESTAGRAQLQELAASLGAIQ